MHAYSLHLFTTMISSVLNIQCTFYLKSSIVTDNTKHIQQFLQLKGNFQININILVF